MPLGKNMGDWIEDFQNSKNKKFDGKSKEERTKMAKAAYMAKYGKKEIAEARENSIVASINPKHPLATKHIEDWTDEDQREYAKLQNEKHGNNTVKDMLKKAVLSKLKEVGPMSPEDKKATDLEIQAEKAKIAAANHRIQNLQKGDATIAENSSDFFEKTIDNDDYVDVSGQSVEMTMEEILADFEERIKNIPEESRKEALSAIKAFWIGMIKDWNPDTTTPHRAPVTEAKHPIFEVREYDYEGQMAKSQLISIVKNAKSLFDNIGDKTQLQSWVQSKLTKAEDYLNAVRSYLDGESISNTAPLMVNNEPKKDDEGVALSVGDVVRGADGRIYQAVHSYSEGKAFLTPFDLKKRKTTNLSERHYFDAVNENEMSPTRKMYKVMPHTQTKGGFTK